MRKLLGTIVILGLVLVAVDITSRSVAEHQLADKAKEGIPAGATIEAHIHSIPFLGRIAANGKIDEVDFHLTDVKAGPLTYPTVDVDLAGVRINRHKLLGKRQVRIASIDSGRLSTELRADDITTALSHRVFIRGGKLYVDALGRQVEVSPKVTGGKQLVLSAAGAEPLTLNLPLNKLLPCAADVAIGASTIQISCAISEVPQPLIDAANAAAGA
jgi:hypothetical protein